MLKHKDHFHGSDLELIEKMYGIKKEEIVSFSANVNPLGISPKLSEDLAKHIHCIETYPDRDYTDLKKSIAAYASCDEKNIIVGNGSTELISLFVQVTAPKKALILGTGGASKAINFGLKSLGLETVFVSRYERPKTIQYKTITPDVIQEYNVIVNCTPLGMYPKTEECPELPYEAMDSHTILYDLIYNPDQTLFMRKGLERGANVKNGLEMLLLQAFASWEFWNGKER